MKISKLFHWLYCAVMFLPLFCLPIYALAVRSDNNYQPIAVQVEEQYTDEVYFNQLLSSATVTGNLNVLNDNSYFIRSPGTVNIEYSLLLTENHVYYFRFDYAFISNGYNSTLVVNFNGETYTVFSSNTQSISDSYKLRFIKNSNLSDNRIRVLTYFDNSANYTGSTYDYLQLFDLTLMYGAGNEPTYVEFEEQFTNVFYNYDSGSNVIIDTGTHFVTYNDTDFGSQTIYTLYKEVDDYFNYDEVLSIGELYEWCNLNLFNGNASLGFFIFFHLLEYWLLTSLLWLIFDILMYVPQLCHRWLDKASLE